MAHRSTREAFRRLVGGFQEFMWEKCGKSTLTPSIINLSLLIYFWDTLLHSTEFLALAFRLWNKKDQNLSFIPLFLFILMKNWRWVIRWPKIEPIGPKISSLSHHPISTATKTVNIHPSPFLSVAASLLFRLRDSNPYLPHASPTHYRLSYSVYLFLLQFPLYKWNMPYIAPLPPTLKAQ